MDTVHFDRLTKRWGSFVSRRSAVGLLSALGIGGVLALPPEADAKKKKGKNPSQRRLKQCKKQLKRCRRTPGVLAASFDLVRADIPNPDCAPNASGQVRIFKLGFAERMEVSVRGLPANTELDLFVTQVPNAPFGLGWYQGDLTTDNNGNAAASFIGRFSEETFIVAVGSADAPVIHPGEDAATNPTTDPVHTLHLGIWFNEVQPGACADGPTPFNGDHTAGIQVLNTRQFADTNGPLRQVTP